MILIKIGHYFLKGKYTYNTNKSSIPYYVRSSSYHWFITRRAILLGICIFSAVWYIAFRYLPLFAVGQNEGWLFGYGKLVGDQSQISYNKGWSMVLMLDLCSLLGILTPLVLIFDRKDKYTLAVANLSILGALLTFYGGFTYVEAPWSFGYLLFGTWTSNDDLPLSFPIHLWMLGMGLYTFLWRRKWEWKDTAKTVAIGLAYCVYVIIITQAMGITTHATALVINDYIPLFEGLHPVYSDFKILFSISDANWPLAVMAAMITFGIFLILVLPTFKYISDNYLYVVPNNDYSVLYSSFHTNRFMNWMMQ